MDKTVLIGVLAIVIMIIVSVALKFLKAPSIGNYHYQRRSLLSKNELIFYKSLSIIASSRGFLLFTKVRLADLISPIKGSQNYQASLNKINQKHIDFILCDKINVQPILAIELDDSSHDRPDRQRRDAFVDQSLQSAGIPILHTRSADKLEENILAAISKKIHAKK